MTKYKELKQLRKKIELLRDEYNYSAHRLGIDLKNISDRDYTVRCSLEKVVDDLENVLK